MVVIGIIIGLTVITTVCVSALIRFISEIVRTDSASFVIVLNGKKTVVALSESDSEAIMEILRLRK